MISLPNEPNSSPRSLNFVKALEFTLPWETGRERDGSLRKDGGLHYRDGNLPTKYGIWQGANRDIDVPSLTLPGAIEVYKDRYWLPYLKDMKPVYVALDVAEIGLAVSVFDGGVNCGVQRMMQWLKQSWENKDPARAVNELRGAFYAAKKDNSNYNGWMNRLNDLKKYVDILRMDHSPS